MWDWLGPAAGSNNSSACFCCLAADKCIVSSWQSEIWKKTPGHHACLWQFPSSSDSRCGIHMVMRWSPDLPQSPTSHRWREHSVPQFWRQLDDFFYARPSPASGQSLCRGELIIIRHVLHATAPSTTKMNPLECGNYMARLWLSQVVSCLGPSGRKIDLGTYMASWTKSSPHRKWERAKPPMAYILSWETNHGGCEVSFMETSLTVTPRGKHGDRAPGEGLLFLWPLHFPEY